MDSISVVIPALQEEAMVAEAIGRALAGAPREVLVVDGGSRDATQERAAAAGALVLVSGPGRGRQMNAGARAAGGDILLFLHADTWLPSGYAGEVRRLLAQPGVAAGAFRLSIRDQGMGPAVMAWGANLRSRLWGLPYGDQALFCRRDVFWAAGGYAEEPLLEDVLLVRSLARLGRIALARQAVATSARRWQARGLWANFLLNQAIMAGHALGVPKARLARWRRQGLVSDPDRQP
ncbi:MAG: TIGR04283 family arsenosugar biosynthesis glycosyltransferase [Thermodesulfobacteriota bacterium]